MICRVYKKEMGQVFNANIAYEIITTDDWKVEIQDIKSKTIFMTNSTTLDKHFIHAYCATCHSSQGACEEIKTLLYTNGINHIWSAVSGFGQRLQGAEISIKSSFSKQT